MKKYLLIALSVIGLTVLGLTVDYGIQMSKTDHILPKAPETPNIPIGNEIKYSDVYGVFIRNCANCHNGETPGRNWLNQKDVEAKSDVMYDRVFIKRDMPLFFRFFGGKDKELLRRYLEQTQITNRIGN